MDEFPSRRRLLSPDYLSCDECYAKLLINPLNDFHPDEVSKILDFEPIEKNIIGTKITNSLGRTREIKISGWFLSSEDYVGSKDLQGYLDWLLNKIEPLSKGLMQL